MAISAFAPIASGDFARDRLQRRIDMPGGNTVSKRIQQFQALLKPGPCLFEGILSRTIFCHGAPYPLHC